MDTAVCVCSQPIIELVRLHPVIVVKEIIDRAVTLMSRFILFWYSMMYMYAAAVDYHRRYTNAKQLTRLITHVPLKNGPSDPLQWNAPIVDVAMPKNAHAFYALRTIVHDLGRRYNVRTARCAILGMRRDLCMCSMEWYCDP